MIISSVVVLLLCIRPNDHAGGLCMSPILLYRENWVQIVLFISKPVDVVDWFRVYSLKFICTVCLVVCKHMRSLSNKFLYYSRRWHSWLRPRYETAYYCFRFERCFFPRDLAVVANVARWKD